MIQQAKETKDVNLRTTLLERAFTLLELPITKSDDPDFKKRRTELYANVIKTAWRGNIKILKVVRMAAPILLESEEKWDPIKDKEIIINQALTCFILAESYIIELEDEELDFASVIEPDDEEGLELGILNNLKFNFNSQKCRKTIFKIYPARN